MAAKHKRQRGKANPVSPAVVIIMFEIVISIIRCCAAPVQHLFRLRVIFSASITLASFPFVHD
jgi:phosphatidylglycerophosphate synthase